MRTLSSTGQTTIASGSVPPLVLLVEMLTTPVVRLNSTPFPMDWNGYTWLGAGTLGTVQEVSDGIGDLPGLEFSMSGVPADAISLALQDNVKWARCTLTVLLLNPSTKAVTDAVQLFSGEINQMPISYGQGAASIGVTVAHRGETFARPKPLRNTDADQQKLYPGDTSRRFVVSQSQKQDVWPAASFFRQ